MAYMKDDLGRRLDEFPVEAMRALRMAMLGDSITNQNSVNRFLVGSGDELYPYNATYNSALWQYYSGQGFWTWANAALGMRFEVIHGTTANNEFGMSGKTAAELVSQGYVAQVIAAAPDWCHLMAGRNDAAAGETAATISARVEAIVDLLLAAGIKVVLSTIIPETTTGTIPVRVRDANDLMRQWAPTKPGVVFNDWYTSMVDPATGRGLAAYYADGVHPYCMGASRMGYRLAKVLETVTPKADFPITSRDLLGLGCYQPGTSGVFGGANPGGGSGQLADNATCYVPASTTIVASKVARTDTHPGFWQQIQQTAGVGAYNYTQRNSNVGVDWSVGDTVYGVLEYETDAASWAANQFYLTLRSLASDQRVDYGYGSDGVLYQPAVAKGIFRTPNLVVPSGTTYLRLDATAGGGTHTARFGRMQIVKV